MFLQRPYFVAALNENPQDPTKSLYGHSYLVVVERCNVGPFTCHEISCVDIELIDH